jgi:ribose-phosphate pyrophosphokinase
MNAIVFSLPGSERIGQALAGLLGAESGRLATRRFPDGEAYVRLETEVAGHEVVLVSSLDHPDEKLLPLAFSAAAAREQGASRVGVVAPYLAYMRQDKRFRPGETVTARHFAKLLEQYADWLVCVDPHLHRVKALREIYSIPAVAAHAAPAMAAWIANSVRDPVIVGPDGESEQWAAEVARGAGCAFTVLEKVRRGDREVEIAMPLASRWRSHTPVLVDDIISTATTMMTTVRIMRQAGLPAPVCVGVHAVFAGQAYEALRNCGAADVISCNTIDHPSNAIDVAPVLAEAVRGFLA